MNAVPWAPCGRRLVCETLGSHVWQRAVHNAPDDWDEEDMHRAMSKALSNPAHSEAQLMLLARPTKFERALQETYERLRSHA